MTNLREDSAASRWVIPMTGRAPDEEHRAATPLELFFDLVFVVAIAQAAGGLHHELAAGHAAEAILNYGMVFFAIWWAWMNFTWFASAYDTDDVPYRLVVLVQMAGALILAAGVSSAVGELDFSLIAGGFVLMRVAMVSQWLRAGRADPPHRATARRYSIGIGVLQVGWVAWLWVSPSFQLVGFLALAAAELLVPMWAERAGATPWHPEHIVERYGLFTIIVLGETILAAATAFREAARDAATFAELAPICVGGVLIVFSLWWLYFARPSSHLHETFGKAFVWGYGHLVIFASVAVVGAGLAVSVDQVTGHAAIGPAAAGATVAFPVAVFLVCMSALHVRPREDGVVRAAIVPLFALAVAASPLTPAPVLVTGLLTALLLATKLATQRSERNPSQEASS